MEGLQKFLQLLNDNWTSILVCIGLVIGIVKKTQDYMSKSQDEKIEIAKKQIQTTILKFVYAGDNSRGVRAEKIIAQPGIEQEVMKTIFGRALVRTASMYVATDDGIMPAITYYANMEK